MRCDAVRQIVEEGLEKTPAIEVHLKSCSACKGYLREWRIVHKGLLTLREEEPPEPSLGFTTRVLRRLENASAEFLLGQQFIDQIGRRIVYATLMVALTLLLVLLLPSSGPFRSSGISQSILVQAQAATLSNEQLLGVGGAESEDASDTSGASSTSYSSRGQGSK